jgi:SPP1 gp7 family putative phage head morphogenesis protein
LGLAEIKMQVNTKQVQNEVLRAENKYAAQILAAIDRLVKKVAHKDSEKDPENISLERDLKSRSIYRQLWMPAVDMYALGVIHATGEKEFQYTGVDNWILSKLTEHTISNISYLSESIKPALEATMVEGRKLGEDNREMAKRIQGVWDVERPRAMMLARTEGNEVYNQATLSSYRAMGGIDAVIYSNPMDERTSPICAMLNRTIWQIDDPGIIRPPAHFFCRSRLLSWGLNGERIPGERDFTKLSTGKTIPEAQVEKNLNRITLFREKYWQVPEINIPRVIKGY